MPNRINYQLEMEKVLRTLDGTRPKLLLHACCAPCSSATLERLAEHFDLSILYYNPNIYPPEEYHRREAELERFVEQAGYHYPVIALHYDPQEFYTAVKGLENEPEKGTRCTVCYRLRLEQAARYAADHGFDSAVIVHNHNRAFADVFAFGAPNVRTQDFFGAFL